VLRHLSATFLAPFLPLDWLSHGEWKKTPLLEVLEATLVGHP
jgi:hypothetical protein